MHFSEFFSYPKYKIIYLISPIVNWGITKDLSQDKRLTPPQPPKLRKSLNPTLTSNFFDLFVFYKVGQVSWPTLSFFNRCHNGPSVHTAFKLRRPLCHLWPSSSKNVLFAYFLPATSCNNVFCFYHHIFQWRQNGPSSLRIRCKVGQVYLAHYGPGHEGYQMVTKWAR